MLIYELFKNYHIRNFGHFLNVMAYIPHLCCIYDFFSSFHSLFLIWISAWNLVIHVVCSHLSPYLTDRVQGCDLISCSTLFQHKAVTCIFGQKHYICCVCFTVFCSNIYRYESAIVVCNMFCRVIFKICTWFCWYNLLCPNSFNTFKGKKGFHF